jgi:hypothetical protein
MIRMTDLKEFKDMLDKQYVDSMNKKEGQTCYFLTRPIFVEVLFKV